MVLVTLTDTFETVDDVCEYLSTPWAPVLAAARRLHAACALDDSPHSDLVRIDACHRLRLGQDQVFAAGGDPVPGYAQLLSDIATYVEAVAKLPRGTTTRPQDTEGQPEVDVTAAHYGALWGGFPPEHYFDEATALLKARLERNGFDLSRAPSERVIDIGCGGGRYSVALKRLGFREVVGVDWSEEGIAVANARVNEAKIEGVTYRRADVLALPFETGEFDVVFSNGVLHHTTNPERGIAEMRRVAKPGGRGWLYLYHRPGGLDRLTHYLARLLLKRSSHEVCRRYCRALNMPANRIFFFLDLWLTPIAESYSPAEMDEQLRTAGFESWRRCTRGEDRDLVEQIHRGEPYADVKYGVGENRYVLET